MEAGSHSSKLYKLILVHQESVGRKLSHLSLKERDSDLQSSPHSQNRIIQGPQVDKDPLLESFESSSHELEEVVGKRQALLIYGTPMNTRRYHYIRRRHSRDSQSSQFDTN